MEGVGVADYDYEWAEGGVLVGHGIVYGRFLFEDAG